MSTQEQTTKSAAAAEVPQPAPTLTPEAVVEQLRALRAQIGDATPLTPEQRRALSARSRASNPVLQASINVIGAVEPVAQVLGLPAADVRQMLEDANRWTPVEDELRVLLNAVTSANLVRRERVAFIAKQAAIIGSRLALDPAHAVLVPHVQEIKRLKRVSRRKKAAQESETPQSPAPATAGGAKA